MGDPNRVRRAAQQKDKAQAKSSSTLQSTYDMVVKCWLFLPSWKLWRFVHVTKGNYAIFEKSRINEKSFLFLNILNRSCNICLLFLLLFNWNAPFARANSSRFILSDVGELQVGQETIFYFIFSNFMKHRKAYNEVLWTEMQSSDIRARTQITFVWVEIGVGNKMRLCLLKN